MLGEFRPLSSQQNTYIFLRQACRPIPKQIFWQNAPISHCCCSFHFTIDKALLFTCNKAEKIDAVYNNKFMIPKNYANHVD